MQIEALSEQVTALTALVRSFSAANAATKQAHSAGVAHTNGAGAWTAETSTQKSTSSDQPRDFEADLLALLGQVDRTGRHGGMIPIPEIRAVFMERGWTRPQFDARLLEAERDFVVDLKTANDPSRLAAPDLAIVEPGRGHLQYVVVR